MILPEEGRRMDDVDQGLARLVEAESDPYYVVRDEILPDDTGAGIAAYFHHRQATSIHEAGHAVAAVLAGMPVKAVYVFPSGSKGNAGRVTFDMRPYRQLAVRLFVRGARSLAKEIVVSFAGPVAELRFHPAHVFSGAKGDREIAEVISKFAEEWRIGDRFEWFDGGWREACRMFRDERVWAAATEIADSLENSMAWDFSNAEVPVARMRGTRVHRIVARHLPDGWDWPGIYSSLPGPNLPPGFVE